MKSDREHARHTTMLEVRFSSATEFVVEYAENLSVGGLFVRKAQGLEPLSEISVQIALPGFGSFDVKARVAHVLDEETATRYKRHAGAGLQLTETPPGFQDALMGYLGRLGRRRDSVVLAEDAQCMDMLAEAGFRAEAAILDRVIEQAKSTTLLAIVVNKGSAQSFRDAIAMASKSIPVIGCDCRSSEEPLLVELDRLLGAGT